MKKSYNCNNNAFNLIYFYFLSIMFSSILLTSLSNALSSDFFNLITTITAAIIIASIIKVTINIIAKLLFVNFLGLYGVILSNCEV